MGEQARDPGFGFARAEGDVRDEWQMGKKLFTYVHSREQKPCTGCVVCTQFDISGYILKAQELMLRNVEQLLATPKT